MITDQCYKAIRRDILTCEMKPGSAVTEMHLCERYGVGKAPVRAALVRLGQEGLIKSVRRQGYIVTPISLRDVEELYQMRLLIEPAVVGEVTRSNRAAKGLANLLEKAASQPMPADIIEGMERNHSFHLALAGLTGNQRLVTSIERLLDDSDRFVYLWMSGGTSVEDLLRGENDHASILEAMRRGDAAQAAAAMLSHIEESRAAIVKNLMDRSSNLDLIVSAT